MTIGARTLLSEGHLISATSQAVFVTPNINPTASRFRPFFIVSRKTDGPSSAPTSLSGLGMEFELLAQRTSSNTFFTWSLWRGQVPAGGALATGPLTITHSTPHQSVAWLANEVAGVLGAAAAIVQSPRVSGSSAGVQSVTLDAPTQEGNAILAFYGKNSSGETYTLDGDLVIMSNYVVPTGFATELVSAVDVSGGQTVTITPTGTSPTAAKALFAIEVADSVNVNPTVTIAQTPASPTAGQTVTLTATATDTDGLITGYAWTHNAPAGAVSTNGAVLTFVAPSTGTSTTYNFSVTATDDRGGSGTATRSITIGGAGNAPTVTITQSPASPKAGETVTLTATGTDTDGTIAGYSWASSAPAGSFSTAGAVVTFVAPYDPTTKLYSFDATVTDNSGATGTATRLVSIPYHPDWIRHPSDGTWKAIGTPAAAPPPPGTVTTVLTATVGDGQVKVDWVITPNGNSVDGAYTSRSGSTVESALYPGLTGSRTFTGLTNGTAITFRVIPVVAGVRLPAVTIVRTPTGASTVAKTGLPKIGGVTDAQGVKRDGCMVMIAGGSLSAYNALEKSAGRKLAGYYEYYSMDNPNVPSDAQIAKANADSEMMHFSIGPWNNSLDVTKYDPLYTPKPVLPVATTTNAKVGSAVWKLKTILSGETDAYWTNVGNRLKKINRKILFNFMHEPENRGSGKQIWTYSEEYNKTSLTAAREAEILKEYADCHRYIRKLWTDMGVDNVLYGTIYASLGGGADLAWYRGLWPGDDQNDFWGWDPYNSGPPNDAAWDWPLTVFDNGYNLAKGIGRTAIMDSGTNYPGTNAKNLPIILGETGCWDTPDTLNGATVWGPSGAAAGPHTDRVEWFRRLPIALRDNYPGIVGVCYFNSTGPLGDDVIAPGDTQCVQAFSDYANHAWMSWMPDA